jgi:hypothetical protein
VRPAGLPPGPALPGAIPVTPEVLPAAGLPPVPALPPKLVDPETPDDVAPPGVFPDGMLAAAVGAAGAGAGVDDVVGAGGSGAGWAGTEGAAEPMAAEALRATVVAAAANDATTTGVPVKVFVIRCLVMLFSQVVLSSDCALHRYSRFLLGALVFGDRIALRATSAYGWGWWKSDP